MNSFSYSNILLSVVTIASWMIGGAVADDEQTPLFPFVVSHDAPDNITNVTNWKDKANDWRHVPAGKYGFIRVENGRFVHNRGRFLIWGTNLCFTANFPEKGDAEKLAARLSRLGFNCVRLHHMDMRDIWGGANAKSQLTLDAAQLDRLDYLVYQLKQHGIYVNLNLHVSRTMDERDGFPNKEGRPPSDKGLDNFHPKLIEVQKKYARDLLEHVNPYTKTAYRNEPAVAMIEINNENSAVTHWVGGGKLNSLGEPYATEFRRQWNEFLLKKYGSTDTLRKAWKNVVIPFGDEILKAGPESERWYVEIDPGVKAQKTGVDNIMSFHVEKMGEQPWHPQLIARNLEMEKGKIYTVSTRIKADRECTLTLRTRRADSPWNVAGFERKVSVDTDWRTFTFSFISSVTGKTRLDITGLQPGFFEVADSSLRPGGKIELSAEQNLEDGTIPILLRYKAPTLRTATDDFCEFLFEIEEKYWLGMYRFLKEELGVKQPVSGTQLGYGSTTIQAKLNYVDIHAYWNHPIFPGDSWDKNNWTIRNRALVDTPQRELLPRLAGSRVDGKPYTVSEFDAPYPNQYAAEALPILAAFGRFQNWDGIFHFAYSHSKSNFETQRAGEFFDMVGNTVKLAHLPACVALFCRGDVQEGKQTVLGAFTPQREMELFKRDIGIANFNISGIGLDPRLVLFRRTALDLSGRQSENIPVVDDLFEKAAGYCTDTRQLKGSFDLETRRKGKFLVDTPNSKLFTGFIEPNEKIEFSDVEIEFYGKTRLGWTTVSLVSVDRNGFASDKTGNSPIRVLLTATGDMRNTDMEIKFLDDEKMTLGNQRGKSPVLCEGISLKIKFSKADVIRCFSLNGHGEQHKEIKVEGNCTKLDSKYKTIWYEIELY